METLGDDAIVMEDTGYGEDGSAYYDPYPDRG